MNIKDRNFIRLVPSDMFWNIRKNYNGLILYKQVGDLTLVMIKEPSVMVPDNLYGLKPADLEIKIPDDNDEREKLFDKAGWNSRYCMPPRLFSEQRLSTGDLYHTGLFMEDEPKYGYSNTIIDKKKAYNGMRLTTSCWFGGAVAVFYPGVAGRLADLFESDFFVTFPSPHEARIHGTRFNDVHQVHDAITEWNRVKYGEFKGMSGAVFRYCAGREEFQQIEYYDWIVGK